MKENSSSYSQTKYYWCTQNFFSNYYWTSIYYSVFIYRSSNFAKANVVTLFLLFIHIGSWLLFCIAPSVHIFTLFQLSHYRKWTFGQHKNVVVFWVNHQYFCWLYSFFFLHRTCGKVRFKNILPKFKLHLFKYKSLKSIHKKV